MLDSQGEGVLEMEDQQKRQMQNQEVEHRVRDIAGSGGETAQVLRANPINGIPWGPADDGGPAPGTGGVVIKKGVAPRRRIRFKHPEQRIPLLTHNA